MMSCDVHLYPHDICIWLPSDLGLCYARNQTRFTGASPNILVAYVLSILGDCQFSIAPRLNVSDSNPDVCWSAGLMF